MPSLAAIARARRFLCSGTAAHRLRAGIAVALIFSSVAAWAATPPLPADHAQRLPRGLELFQREVRSLLSAQCLKCHGGEKVKGALDISTREGLLQGGENGPAVVLYDAPASRLYQLINHAKEPYMPSKAEKLPVAAVEKIAAWINDGAPYDKPLIESKGLVKKDRGAVTDKDRQWWSFLPLKKASPPKVASASSVRNPIDAFLLSTLEAKKLHYAPRSDRRTLIRRASFDLLGIPPTPQQVREFEKDNSPDAWDKVIRAMLDNPGYGERWARHWLDVARFAESSGFEHDYDRPNAYHYRDFVIKALNSDLPYDQFVRWQLAGDEFEPNNPLALMATGFLGAGVFPTQITANEVERTRYDALDDMLATTGTAMLGLTVGCARCHDHKFDPIPTQDYYRLLTTFTTTVRSDIELDLQPEQNRSAREKHEREHAPLVAALARYESDTLPGAFEAWLKQGAPYKAGSEWSLLEPTQLISKAGATFKKLNDGSYLAEGKNGDTDVYTFHTDVKTRGVRALRLEALAHPSMPKGGPGRADNGNIGLSRIHVYATPLQGGATNEVKLVRPRASFEQNSGGLAIASALDNDPHTGWAVDPKFGTNHAAIFEFESPLDLEGGAHLQVRLEFELNTRHNIGRLRLGLSTTAHPRLDSEALPESLVHILDKAQKSSAGLTTDERSKLLGWWKNSEPGWVALHDKVDVHQRNAPKPTLTKVLVCAEGYPPNRMHTQGADFFPETYFLQRGSTDMKKGVATQGVLQVLGRDSDLDKRWRFKAPEGARYSGRRRTLANWMTDTDQGAGALLARVMVNRLWQHHFGQGLVSTPNDFGVQGTKPSNPDLLDWLAGELIRNGWRLKTIHQLIMNSAAYQQSSKADPASHKLDPGNALVSHYPPHRLQAEAIRDSLLAVSGVIDPTMYGPGTLDEASRRRSIYFTVKRSLLVPGMQVFDAPEPLVSQGTRPTTTVAPQALLLMNSPHVRSWAAAFAKRFCPDERQSLAKAVSDAYGLALNRAPTRVERSEALAFIEQQMARYRSDKQENARDQALTDFAQVVLSLNELIYVE